MNETTGILYPEIKVTLTGQNGNAFNLIAIVSRAMRKHGLSEETVEEFQKKAMSGDYDNVLQTCMRYVHVD